MRVIAPRLPRASPIILSLWCSTACASKDAKREPPPPGIDVDVCAHVTYVDASSPSHALNDCEACCTAAGFSQHVFVSSAYDHCVCGNPRPTVDDREICASQAASADACIACCQAADFAGAMQANGYGCKCTALYNATVCANAVNDSDPIASCAACCLENIYFDAWYSESRNTCFCG